MEEEKLEKTIYKQPKILHVQLYKIKKQIKANIHSYSESLNEIKSSLKGEETAFPLALQKQNPVYAILETHLKPRNQRAEG